MTLQTIMLCPPSFADTCIPKETWQTTSSRGIYRKIARSTSTKAEKAARSSWTNFHKKTVPSKSKILMVNPDPLKEGTEIPPIMTTAKGEEEITPKGDNDDGAAKVPPAESKAAPSHTPNTTGVQTRSKATSKSQIDSPNEKALQDRPHRGRLANFPNKLYALLRHAANLQPSGETETKTWEIGWSHDGTFFYIGGDAESFMSTLGKEFFPHQSCFRALERQLNSWGWKRKPITFKAKEKHFVHPYFHRDHPEWLRKIVRHVNTKPKRKANSLGGGRTVRASSNIPAWATSHQEEALKFMRQQQQHKDRSPGKEASRQYGTAAGLLRRRIRLPTQRQHSRSSTRPSRMNTRNTDEKWLGSPRQVRASNPSDVDLPWSVFKFSHPAAARHRTEGRCRHSCIKLLLQDKYMGMGHGKAVSKVTFTNGEDLLGCLHAW